MNIDVTISIHALLAESDEPLRKYHTTDRAFLSTLSLRRATCSAGTMATSGATFLSTLSLRRATSVLMLLRSFFDDFYPRSPCGERPPYFSQPATLFKFLSTLSLRRATAAVPHNCGCRVISIHALLAESDAGKPGFFYTQKRFLSTLSLRRATSLTLYAPSSALFLSTLSLRRATRFQDRIIGTRRFLSTLSLRRATQLPRKGTGMA